MSKNLTIASWVSGCLCLILCAGCSGNGATSDTTTMPASDSGSPGTQPAGPDNVVPTDLLPTQVFAVKFDATGNGTGTSWKNAFTSLSVALDHASGTAGAVTEIWVAKGAYRPSLAADPRMASLGADPRDASFAMFNNLGVYGGFAGVETDRGQRDPAVNVTILSGDLKGDNGPNFTNNSDNAFAVVTADTLDETAVLDGFTITAGNGIIRAGGIDIEGDKSGNGPIISNCNIVLNATASSTGFGAGMTIEDSDPTIENCIFAQNRTQSGGGLGVTGTARPKLTDCTFRNNSAIEGAGVMVRDSSMFGTSPQFIRCTFSGNAAQMGGGLLNDGGEVELSNCRFLTNQAAGSGATINGGGLHHKSGASFAINCTFSQNSAATFGGAVYSEADGLGLFGCLIDSNVVTVGAGGGVFNARNAQIINCTIVNNTAQTDPAGLEDLKGTSTIANCILFGNKVGAATGQGEQFATGSPATTTIHHCDIQGLVGVLGGGNNIATNPLFVNASISPFDFHLQAGSPCIDKGDNISVPPPITTDLDGNTRLQGAVLPIVDIGAYEFQP